MFSVPVNLPLASAAPSLAAAEPARPPAPEIAATPRFTITGDVIGAVRPHASNLFRSPVLGDQQLIAHSEVDAAIGGKWKLGGDKALLFNLLVPMNNAGIRPTTVITAGIQMQL